MKKIRFSNSESALIILLITTNFFIIVEAGQAFGFLGMAQLLSIFYWLNDSISFTFAGNYDDRLFAAGLFGLAGNILLLVALFSHTLLFRLRHIIIGAGLLFFSFVLLTQGLGSESAAQVSFWSGLPFIAVGILLSVYLLKKYRQALIR